MISDELVLKMNLLGGMNEYIKMKTDDEDFYYYTWATNGIPDDCDEETLMEIANDSEEFLRICKEFARLVNTYNCYK